MIFKAKICLSMNFLIDISQHIFQFKRESFFCDNFMITPLMFSHPPIHMPWPPSHLHFYILLNFYFKQISREMQDELATLGHINILSCLYMALLQGRSTPNSYAALSVGSHGAEDSNSKLNHCQELTRASQKGLST